MNSRGCMTQTTVSGLPRPYRLPVTAAVSAVRSTTFRVTVPSGTSRGLQSVLRKPAVTAVGPVGALAIADKDTGSFFHLGIRPYGHVRQFFYAYVEDDFHGLSGACPSGG